MSKKIFLISVTIGTQKNYVCDVISQHPSMKAIVSYTTKQEEAKRFDSLALATGFVPNIHNPHNRNFEAIREIEAAAPVSKKLILKQQKLQ
jgi:hypothetical protein